MPNEKRVVLIATDGTETELAAPWPNAPYEAMSKAVGGLIEIVRVLDTKANPPRDTYMLVNEEGLLLNLERNEKATEILQRRVRAAYPNDPNPYATARVQALKAYEEAGVFVIMEGGDLTDPDNPHIAGPVVYFDGYTAEELDDLWRDDD